MTIANASSNDANDVLNIFHQGGNVLLGKNSTFYVPVIINNASGTRNVYLYLYGKAVGASASAPVHGVSRHYHGNLEIRGGGTAIASTTGSSFSSWTAAKGVQFTGGEAGDASSVGDSTYSLPLAYTAVPKDVQIWIDGVQYTSTIGDPNTKGATMYDSVNNDWGIDGTTVWNTGRLNLSSLISWTAGEHYIEIKETGASGGVLVYQVCVNSGY